MLRKFWVPATVCFLLLVFTAEVALSTRQESPSWDEGDHIYSGYMNWKHRAYFLNPEHPPLVKLIAALPLLPLQLKIPPRQGRYFKTEAYFGGRELLFRNSPQYGGLYSADTLLFRIHMAVFVFAFVLAILVFLTGQQMFSSTAGLIALILLVFDPTILTNAPFVTTDTGAACGCFATVFAFYRFTQSMRWQRALLCGLALSLALATKHSMVVLAPILLLLALGELFFLHQSRRAPTQFQSPRRLLLGLSAIAAIALLVLWAIYSFRFAMVPSGVDFPSLSSRMAPLSPLSRALISFCARFHLLPLSYLYGMADVQSVGLGMPAYIFGRLYSHGQWFYFPALLSLKWSIGVLGLLALTLYALITGKVHRPRQVFYLALPPLLYLAIAMAAPLNIGIRHILPIFPFTFVLAGAGAATLLHHRRAWAFAVVPLLLCHAIDSLRSFPNYMPYANPLWGGPANTHLYFSDSATDWGQQLKWTSLWLRQHHVQHCWFAYFPGPFLQPSDYGIPCKPLPTADTMGAEDIYLPPVLQGPILISFSDLNGFEFGSKVRNPYQPLFLRQPDAVIANGIAVFNGTFSLPAAAALTYIDIADESLPDHPQAALAAARSAVQLDPLGFDANLALGNALSATHQPQAARAAYLSAQRRIPDMEPSSQQNWAPILTNKLQQLPSPIPTE